MEVGLWSALWAFIMLAMIEWLLCILTKHNLYVELILEWDVKNNLWTMCECFENKYEEIWTVSMLSNFQAWLL